jgi:hypothetical protein
MTRKSSPNNRQDRGAAHSLLLPLKMEVPRLGPSNNLEGSGDRVNNFRTEPTMTPESGLNEGSMPK